MSFSTNLVLLQRIQHICFVLAQVNNTILLLLIRFKASEKFGSYRYLMATFASYSLVYAWVEITTLPIMHIKVPVFAVMMGNDLKMSVGLKNFIASLYSGSFGLCISLLAAHFVYRYLVVCKPHYSNLISGLKCFHVIWPCLILFLLWFLFVSCGMRNTVEKQEYLRSEVLEFYDKDITQFGLVACMFWNLDANGRKSWKLDNLFATFGCDFIIAACVTVILFCGISIYRDLHAMSNMMSTNNRELQRQLFSTLTFQTLLPFVLMYTTVLFIITSPLFNLALGSWANIAGITVALYPALEPCVAILCIRDFRNALLCSRRESRSEVPAASDSKVPQRREVKISPLHPTI